MVPQWFLTFESLDPNSILCCCCYSPPRLPSGTIASKPGPLMAAAEVFEVTLVGQGGHAAMVRPHKLQLTVGFVNEIIGSSIC